MGLRLLTGTKNVKVSEGNGFKPNVFEKTNAVELSGNFETA